MAKETTVNVRIDAKTKKKAAKVFARCGLTTSEAVRLFLNQTAMKNEFLYDIHIYNPEKFNDLGPYSDPQTVDEFMSEVKSLKDEIEGKSLKAKSSSKRNAKG